MTTTTITYSDGTSEKETSYAAPASQTYDASGAAGTDTRGASGQSVKV